MSLDWEESLCPLISSLSLSKVKNNIFIKIKLL